MLRLGAYSTLFKHPKHFKIKFMNYIAAANTVRIPLVYLFMYDVITVVEKWGCVVSGEVPHVGKNSITPKVWPFSFFIAD